MTKHVRFQPMSRVLTNRKGGIREPGKSGLGPKPAGVGEVATVERVLPEARTIDSQRSPKRYSVRDASWSGFQIKEANAASGAVYIL
jgi:hypothetical protein